MLRDITESGGVLWYLEIPKNANTKKCKYQKLVPYDLDGTHVLRAATSIMFKQVSSLSSIESRPQTARLIDVVGITLTTGGTTSKHAEFKLTRTAPEDIVNQGLHNHAVCIETLKIRNFSLR